MPSMQFLVMEGVGSRNDNPVFEAAVSALYSCAYSIKFDRKKAGVEPEYSVQPLEGHWWVEARILRITSRRHNPNGIGNY